MKAQLTIKDWELLSAYRDGELSKAECEKLEKRLQSDQVLRNALSDLGITHELLGCLPRKQVPYHFTLTRAMLPQGSRWALPLSLGFSLASVSSLVLILLTFTMQLLPAAKVSLEAMPEAEMAQDSAVNEEVAGESPLIVWGTPGAAPEPIGGYGGGAEQPYVGSGGVETYMQPTPVAISPPRRGFCHLHQRRSETNNLKKIWKQQLSWKRRLLQRWQKRSLLLKAR